MVHNLAVLSNSQVMKKALVTIAVGEKYEQMELETQASRVAYANRHGYDYIVYKEMPADWVEIKKAYPKNRQANMFKLYLPTLQQDYDFVAFIDTDTYVNPKAPCLSQFEPRIPKEGFAACVSYTWEERHRYWPNWARTYYEGLVERYGVTMPELWNERLDINGGLMLYRPREIAERWRHFSEMDTPLTQENLLNIHDLQNGLCYMMQDVWNRVWYYQKFRLGLLKPVRSEFGRYRNAFVNRYCSGIEKRLLRTELDRCFMMHFAYEHKKTLWALEMEHA